MSSPKVQDQAVGLPADVSVNETIWPVMGVTGAKVKAADGIGDTEGLDNEEPPSPQPWNAKVPNSIPIARMVLIA